MPFDLFDSSLSPLLLDRNVVKSVANPWDRWKPTMVDKEAWTQGHSLLPYFNDKVKTDDNIIEDRAAKYISL